jgi:hypothetical protein
LVSRKFRCAGPLETAAGMTAWRWVWCTENGRVEGAGTGAIAALEASSKLGLGLKEGLAIGVLVTLIAGLLCEPVAVMEESVACMVEGVEYTGDLQVVKRGARCTARSASNRRRELGKAVSREYDCKRAGNIACLTSRSHQVRSHQLPVRQALLHSRHDPFCRPVSILYP